MVLSILDFERSRNHRQGYDFLTRERDFMRWFPVAFLANGVFLVTLAGFEPTTLRYESSHLTTSPLYHSHGSGNEGFLDSSFKFACTPYVNWFYTHDLLKNDQEFDLLRPFWLCLKLIMPWRHSQIQLLALVWHFFINMAHSNQFFAILFCLLLIFLRVPALVKFSKAPLKS